MDSQENVGETAAAHHAVLKTMPMRADYLSRLRGPGTMRKTMRQDGVVVN